MKKLISLALVLLIAAGSFMSVTASAVSVLPYGTDFKLTNTKSGIKITFKKGKDSPKYYLYKKTAVAKKFKKIKTFNKAGSYTDKKVMAGKKYSYKMATLNGCIYVDTKAQSITCIKGVPSVKVKMCHHYDVYKYEDSFETLEDREVYYRDYLTLLSWKKVKGASEYEIYQAAVKGNKTGKYKKLAASKSTSFTVGYYETKEGVYYKYKVRAANGKTKGVFSSATHKYGFLRAPITINSYYMNNKGYAVVGWRGCAKAKGYLIYRSDDGGKTYKLIKDYECDIYSLYSYSSYTDSSAEDGKIYHYYVVAYNDEMKSNRGDTDVIEDISKNFDVSLKVGETASNYLMSVLYRDYIKVGASDISVTSDNESTVKVNTEKISADYYNVKLTATKEGYANITLKADINGKTKKKSIRVFVYKDKCYNALFWENKVYRLEDLDERIAEVYSDIKAEYNVTSDNENVARVDSGKFRGFTIKALSKGEAVINIKITVDGKEVYNKNYTIVVD